jgi:hypothetical protein
MTIKRLIVLTLALTVCAVVSYSHKNGASTMTEQELKASAVSLNIVSPAYAVESTAPEQKGQKVITIQQNQTAQKIVAQKDTLKTVKLKQDIAKTKQDSTKKDSTAAKKTTVIK